MIIRVLLSVFLFGLPAAATAAETLSIRAGEHGDYSRLVIADAPEGWRIATSDRKIEITFPSKDYAFELSDIIDKRKAHRVLNARVIDAQESRALVLSLTCDCPVRTSKGDDDSIVIDIFNDAPAAPVSDATNQPDQTVSNEARQNATATPESIKAARDRMIALLAEARHQGVVQLKKDEEERPLSATAITEAAMTPEPAPSQIEETSGVSAPDIAPLSLSEPAQQNEETEVALNAAANAMDPASCVDPTIFDQPEENETVLNYAAITNLRQRFDSTQDDEERRAIAATLALAYVHIGFFEEAIAISLAQAQEEDQKLRAIGGLAAIAANEKGLALTILSPLRHCGPLMELAYAAAEPQDSNAVKNMMREHIAALTTITTPLRAPIAETLGLNALEQSDTGLAREFYAIARKARGRERSPALAILESALGNTGPNKGASDESDETQAHSKPAAGITEEIKQIAQTPGPLQAKALAMLAEDYEQRADEAYEGFLDDIASQSRRRGSSLSEARASLAGARALVSAGRLREGVRVLEAAANSAPDAREASETLAHSVVMNALLADDETRLEAVASFFEHRDFLQDNENGDLNIAVARELAAYGANELVVAALNGAPPAWAAQGDAIKALSYLNSGDAQSALDLSAQGQSSNKLSIVTVRAYERLNDKTGVIAAIKSSIGAGVTDAEFTKAAWRAEDWALAVDAFEKTPEDQQTESAAKRASLAALNTNAGSLPKGAQEALAEQPDALRALTHMFKKAPAVNVRTIDVLADFSTGLRSETNFMETGLGAGGD